MEARIASILRAAKFDGADNLVAQAQTVIDSEMAKLAAAARRRAVLAGLAKLGYEVRETMSTAWAHDGRLVIRKPNATDYGIELGASPEVTCLSSRRPFRCLDGLRGIPGGFSVM
jgi:hypothetical protein